MISRLSIQEGLALPRNSEYVMRHLGELAVARDQDFLPVDVGEYDLTPSSWRQNLYRHQLIVLGNGEGCYRMIPLSLASATITQRLGDDEAILRAGGEVRDINSQSPLYGILGRDPRSLSNLRLFEVIRYQPEAETLYELAGQAGSVVIRAMARR